MNTLSLLSVLCGFLSRMVIKKAGTLEMRKIKDGNITLKDLEKNVSHNLFFFVSYRSQLSWLCTSFTEMYVVLTLHNNVLAQAQGNPNIVQMFHFD